MIVTLYDTEVTIADMNRFEHVKMIKNYSVNIQTYITTGTKYIDIKDDNTMIDITSKHVCV